jgi:hypothetical protein
VGREYEAEAVFGFWIDEDELDRAFLKHREEESHCEERYDQKTGEFIGTVRVVDVKEGDYYHFGGNWEENRFSLVDSLREALGKIDKCIGVGCHQDKYGDILAIVIGDGVENKTAAQVAKLEARLKKARNQIRKLTGLKLGPAKVWSTLIVC